MPEQERTDNGTYVETVSLEAVLSVFDEVRGPAITSRDVADALDCTTEAARQKLKILYERREVDKRKSGRTMLWWRAREGPDDESVTHSARGAGVTDDHPPPEMSETPSEADASPSESVEYDEAGDPVDEIISGWRPEQSPGGRRDARRAAGRAALEYLRESGEPRQAAEFKRDVEPEHPVEDQSPDTWWKKSARPALNRAQEVGIVEYIGGRKEYEWIGNDGTVASR